MSFMLAKVSGLTRSPGDPKVIETGPSSITAADRFGHALGWFSMGLGLTELLAPKALTRWLGMEGKEGLVRAYGAREIASGVLCLSVNKDYGAWSRVGGDVLDLATLSAAYTDDNPKKRNVGIAIAAVAGIAIIDALTAQTVRSIHDRKGEPVRDYSDRSGFPKGAGYSRGKAAGQVPQDYRATPAAAAASPATGATSPASADLQLEVSGWEARPIRGEEGIASRGSRNRREEATGFVRVRGAREHNLKNVDVDKREVARLTRLQRTCD